MSQIMLVGLLKKKKKNQISLSWSSNIELFEQEENTFLTGGLKPVWKTGSEFGHLLDLIVAVFSQLL